MKEVPILIKDLEPKDAAYSQISDRKTVYPTGVRPVTQNLLNRGFETGAFESLDPDKQDLLSRYFGTGMSGVEANFGGAITTSRDKIQRAIKDLRANLSTEEQIIFSGKDVLMLKEAPSVRTGWHHTRATKKAIGKKARERATPEYRKKQSERTKAFMTQEVKDKISATSKKRMTKSRRQKIGRSLKGPRGRHSFSSEKAREAAEKRWVIKKDLTHEERREDPVKGAVSNLDYVNGGKFPPEIRRYFQENPNIRVEWYPILADIRRLPFIRYQDGKLWLINVRETNGQELKMPLDQSTLMNDPDNALKFGLLSRIQIIEALKSRMR